MGRKLGLLQLAPRVVTQREWQPFKGEGHAEHIKPKITDLLMTEVACAISLVVLGVVLTLSKIVHIVCFFVIMWQVINDEDDAGEGNTRSAK